MAGCRGRAARPWPKQIYHLHRGFGLMVIAHRGEVLWKISLIVFKLRAAAGSTISLLFVLLLLLAIYIGVIFLLTIKAFSCLLFTHIPTLFGDIFQISQSQLFSLVKNKLQMGVGLLLFGVFLPIIVSVFSRVSKLSQY